MAFNDDLMDALRKSVEYYNGSHDANAALAKAASDMGFNLDQAERLVEKFNTARTISYFEHHPDDRTQNFDIASKEKVAEYLVNGAPSEKKASAEEYGGFDYSQYYGDEKDYRRKADTPDLEKMGEERLPPSGSRELAGCSVSTLTDVAHKAILNKEGEAERLEDAAGMVRADIATHLDEFVGRIKLGFDAGNRYALFKEACGNNSEVFETVSAMLPDWVKEEAKPYISKYASVAVVDLQDMAYAAEKADRIENAMKRASEFEERAERLRKEASDMRSKLYKAAAPGFPGNFNPPPSYPSSSPRRGGGNDSGSGGRGQGGSGGGNRGGQGQGGGGEDDKKKKKQEKESPWVLQRLTQPLQGVSNPWMALGLPSSESAVYETVFKPTSRPDTTISDHIDNLMRSDIVSDLYANDPILSEADPKALSAAYKSLVQTAPEASLNKEVTRAILRQMVSAQAVTPFEAGQWADFDKKQIENKTKKFGK